MLKKILNKFLGSKATQGRKQTAFDLNIHLLLHAIQEQTSEDPLIGAKVCGKELFLRLQSSMTTERGIHIESLLCAMGALAGYACQAGLRAQAVSKGMPEAVAFQIMGTQDGKQYFFGEHLNYPLVNSQYSVWELAAAEAQHAGAREPFDLEEIFSHTVSSIGGDQFGIPRVTDTHKPDNTPLNYLTVSWPALFPLVKFLCPDPALWSVTFGLAIQSCIDLGKNVIAPHLALKIVMESAVAMSKVDLQKS